MFTIIYEILQIRICQSRLWRFMVIVVREIGQPIRGVSFLPHLGIFVSFRFSP